VGRLGVSRFGGKPNRDINHPATGWQQSQSPQKGKANASERKRWPRVTPPRSEKSGLGPCRGSCLGCPPFTTLMRCGQASVWAIRRDVRQDAVPSK